MELIKKYYIYGIYILVVLASLGLYIWSVMLNGDNVQGYDQINSQYTTAANLSNQVVRQNEIEFYNSNITKAEEDKRAVMEFCKSTSSRPYLYKNIFPYAPQDVSKQYYTNFATEYCKGIDSLLNVVHGGDRPTQLEESNYLASARRTTNTDQGGAGGGMIDPRGGGRAAGGMAATTADEELLIEMRKKRADEISIYTNQESFVLYDFWKAHDGSSGTTYSLQYDSWFSQIAYWIQEDVAMSVNKINSTSKSVKENAVKRLIEVSFGGSQASSGSASANAMGGRGMGDPRGGGRGMDTRAMGGRGGAANYSSTTTAARSGDINALPAPITIPTDSTATADAGAAAATGSSATLLNTMTTPWTKHASNDLMDVFHFSIRVIVASDKVNELINALQSARANADGSNSRNQITVLQFNLNPVSVQAEEAAGYYYGATALVQADLVCQYAFFRSGYDSMMPENAKKDPTTTAIDGSVISPGPADPRMIDPRMPRDPRMQPAN